MADVKTIYDSKKWNPDFIFGMVKKFVRNKEYEDALEYEDAMQFKLKTKTYGYTKDGITLNPPPYGEDIFRRRFLGPI